MYSWNVRFPALVVPPCSLLCGLRQDGCPGGDIWEKSSPSSAVEVGENYISREWAAPGRRWRHGGGVSPLPVWGSDGLLAVEGEGLVECWWGADCPPLTLHLWHLQTSLSSSPLLIVHLIPSITHFPSDLHPLVTPLWPCPPRYISPPLANINVNPFAERQELTYFAAIVIGYRFFFDPCFPSLCN